MFKICVCRIIIKACHIYQYTQNIITPELLDLKSIELEKSFVYGSHSQILTELSEDWSEFRRELDLEHLLRNV